MNTSQIDIIIPVLDDIRILTTIESLRYFDDVDGVRLVIMAGSSSEAFLGQLRPALAPRDILSTEPDAGIFDALNKGLDQCTAPVVGWLGSDDVFSGQVRASDVAKEFAVAGTDALVYSTEYHENQRITRRLSSRWSKRSLIPWGFHNPHFSTFLARHVYDKKRFPISEIRKNLFSDITYFADLLSSSRTVLRDPVCTYMAEGGSASGTLRSVRYNFQQRYHLYKNMFGLVNGVVAPILCLLWKFTSVVQYKLSPKTCTPLWQPAQSVQQRS